MDRLERELDKQRAAQMPKNGKLLLGLVKALNVNIDGEIRLPAGEEMKKKAQMSTIGLNLLTDANFTDTNFKEGTPSTHVHGHRDMPRFWPRFCLPAQTPRSATDKSLQTQPQTPEEGVAVEESESFLRSEMYSRIFPAAATATDTADPSCNTAPEEPLSHSNGVGRVSEDGVCVGEKRSRLEVDGMSTDSDLTTDTADHSCNTAPEEPLSHSNGVGRVSEDGVCVGVKRSRDQLHELLQLKIRQKKWERKYGAIVAPSRTGEGYKLPTGNWLTCVPDAGYNSLITLGFKNASLQRLRTASIFKLGNDLERQASWSSLSDAFVKLEYPFKLVEATARFKCEGGPLLNLLKASAGVYLVALAVTLDGKRSNHCVMLSTIPEKQAPFGKLIDNHSSMKPVYLEKKDVKGKEAAKNAWKDFLAQHPEVMKHANLAVEATSVYQIVPI